MSGSSSTTPFSHDEAFDLLPWYVTETLSDEEAQGVRDHIRTCLVCRRELDAQQRISDLVADTDAVPLSAHSSFRALMAQINAPRDGKSRRGFETSRWLAWTTSPLPVAAGLGALLLIGILMVVSSDGPDRAPAYQTLARDVELAPEGKPSVQLIFAEPVEHSEAVEIVSALGAELIAGPRAAGTYTLRVEQEDLDAVLEKLRRDSRVRFAERTRIVDGDD